MKRASGAWIGTLFLIVGLLYAGSALDLFEFTIFFDGFWTLFIIVPCFYGLFKKGENKTWCSVGLLLGICLLINAQDIGIHIDFGPMLLAVICVAIGVNLLFPNKNKSKKHIAFEYHTGSDANKEKQPEATAENAETSENDNKENGNSYDNYSNYHYSKNTDSGYLNISTVFGAKEYRMDNEIFTGASISCVFGGAELDLRHAVISEDVYVDVSVTFGGVDIFLPPDVRVVTDGCSCVLGGIDVKRAYSNIPAMDAPKVIITGSCVFGGIDVK